MTRSGPAGPPQRRGFLAALSQALAPLPPVDTDDTTPPKLPRGVFTAAILGVLSGLLFLFEGIIGLTAANTYVKDSKDQYAKDLVNCQPVGGFGTNMTVTASPTPTSLTSLASSCKAHVTVTNWDSVHTFYVVVFTIFVIIGLAVGVSGWFLRFGARWARITLTVLVIVMVLATLFLGISGTFTLAATVALLIAVVLCYISTGGLYFQRIRALRRPS